MTPNTATIGDTPMRWLEQDGTGTPIVLVHGIPTSPALWRHVTPHLTGRRVLAFEMTGYGESIPAGTGRDISVSAQADRLLAWLDHLGITSAIFVGDDLGGGVVHIAAVRRPGICAGLMITNGIGYDSWPIPSVKAMRLASPAVSKLPAIGLKPSLAMLLLRGHDQLSLAKQALGVHYKPYAKYGGGAAMARQVNSLNVNDTLALAGQIPSLSGKPARIVWGVADQFQKVEYGERFARDPGVTMRRIDGGKHFTPEDHPDVIAQEILSLADEVDATA
jgi:pimeloyl-ACP methyl ester carboxylesterase